MAPTPCPPVPALVTTTSTRFLSASSLGGLASLLLPRPGAELTSICDTVSVFTAIAFHLQPPQCSGVVADDPLDGAFSLTLCSSFWVSCMGAHLGKCDTVQNVMLPYNETLGEVFGVSEKRNSGL